MILPLCKNKYTASFTLSIFQELITLPPWWGENEEEASHDAESLCRLHHGATLCGEKINTNVSVKKLTFKILLFKFATWCKFTFLSSFYQQTDDGAIGGWLSGTSNYIYMVKLENNVVLLKSIFYCRNINDMFYRRKAYADDLF